MDQGYPSDKLSIGLNKEKHINPGGAFVVIAVRSIPQVGLLIRRR